jgi:hypothetical protein
MLLGWLCDHVSFASALRANALLFIVSGLAFGLWARETVRGRPLPWPKFLHRPV